MSVIVPNFNHAPFLPRRLDSVVEQTHRNLDILLLDDASTDGSRDILKSYAQRDGRIRLLLNDENSGSPFCQWKRGIEETTAPFIWIAESDDFSEPDFLARVLPAFQDTQVGVSYAQSCMTWGDGTGRRLWSDTTPNEQQALWASEWVMDGHEYLKRWLVPRCCIPNASSAVFTRKAYDATEGVRTDFRMSGDYMFWCQLALVSSIAYTPDALNYWYVGGEGSPSRRGMFDGTYVLEALKVLAAVSTGGHEFKACVDQRVQILCREWLMGHKGPEYSIKALQHLHILWAFLRRRPAILPHILHAWTVRLGSRFSSTRG